MGGSSEVGRTRRLLVWPYLVNKEKWRAVACLCILGFVLCPSGILIVTSLSQASPQSWAEVFYRPFYGAAARSLQQMVWVVAIALIIGVPFGLSCRLLPFPFKGVCYYILLLPLMVPPFLWAIGIQCLKASVSYRWQVYFDGPYGAIIAYSTMVMPLVALGTVVISWRITQSECDAAFLAGGWLTVFTSAFRYVFAGVVAVAVVASLLTLGDAGCGQIMGFHGIPSEIQIAFAARGDFQVAALKAVVTCLLGLPLVLAASWVLIRYMNFADLATAGRGNFRPTLKWRFGDVLIGIGMLSVAAVLLLPAWIGLVRPLVTGGPSKQELAGAFSLLRDSFPVTLKYWVAAGCAGTLPGFLLAVCAGQNRWLQRLAFATSLIFLSIPPAIHALGIVLLRTRLRIASAGNLDSDLLVGATLGLRFMPVATSISLVAWRKFPRSFHDAAAILGVPLFSYCMRVIVPLLRMPLLISIATIGFLALADVSTALLLQQPGGASFGAHLFAVMDNSSEKNVAALCLAYMLFPAVGLVALFALARLSRLLQNQRPGK